MGAGFVVRERTALTGFTVEPGTTRTTTARCREGDRVTGGGHDLLFGMELLSQGPNATSDGWDVRVRNPTTSSPSLTVYVVCAGPA